MNAVHLLAEVHQHGGRLALVEGRVKLSAPAPLPDELLARLRRHKPELLALLAANDTDDVLPTGPCSVCGCLSWWLQAAAWHCQRCTPPTGEQLDRCETYVADPGDPPQSPPPPRQTLEAVAGGRPPRPPAARWQAAVSRHQAAGRVQNRFGAWCTPVQHAACDAFYHHYWRCPSCRPRRLCTAGARLQAAYRVAVTPEEPS